MKPEKKIEILNGQIKKLESSDFHFRNWLNETQNLLDLIFENADIKKHQLKSATQRPDYMYDGVIVKELKVDWRKLIEGFRYEIELLMDEQPTIELDNEEFINSERIYQLKNLNSQDFDFSKLMAICQELNSNFSNRNYLSVSMLCRALIDHVPPVFNTKTFNEVANNYGSMSFKKNMLHLNNSLRNIADTYLHQQIRKKETLPNKTQIDFKNDIDVLIAEIIRIV